MFTKLKPLENKGKLWFVYHLPELAHEDIQADFDREIIADIIQKYKDYISKLEDKIEMLAEENKQLKNKITLD